MAYRVEITLRAERDLESIYIQINGANSEAAREWHFGLTAAILSLRQMPNRNPGTRERKRLRQLLYGQKPNVYRIIFRVVNKPRVAEVLRIRHGARQTFGPSDLRV